MPRMEMSGRSYMSNRSYKSRRVSNNLSTGKAPFFCTVFIEIILLAVREKTNKYAFALTCCDSSLVRQRQVEKNRHTIPSESDYITSFFYKQFEPFRFIMLLYV